MEPNAERTSGAAASLKDQVSGDASADFLEGAEDDEEVADSQGEP